MKFPNKDEMPNGLGPWIIVTSIVLAFGMAIAIAKSNYISVKIDALGLDVNVNTQLKK